MEKGGIACTWRHYGYMKSTLANAILTQPGWDFEKKYLKPIVEVEHIRRLQMAVKAEVIYNVNKIKHKSNNW